MEIGKVFSGNKDALKKAQEEYQVYLNSLEDVTYEFDDELERKLASIVKEDGLSKAKDLEIAEALGLKPQNYSNKRRRGIVPLKNIVELCLRKNININWVLCTKQPLSKQEDATKAIEDYTKCRANQYKRILGKFTGNCKGYVRFMSTLYQYSCMGDCKDLPTTEIRYIKEDDIFSPDYKKRKTSIFLKIIWLVILLGIAYYFGYSHGLSISSEK
ncbi:hypothetical protein [Sulfurimonas microaerophilic]|uniref:hypothetical protein n=1 Tax=Sulfurimonas microaerophilic TaxID=3058392 RepID=UPI0027154505|nr:hypothetical protein [Sulfurimonas sp. hsl 1-7]